MWHLTGKLLIWLNAEKMIHKIFSSLYACAQRPVSTNWLLPSLQVYLCTRLLTKVDLSKKNYYALIEQSTKLTMSLKHCWFMSTAERNLSRFKVTIYV
jgi:hypothetical protein